MGKLPRTCQSQGARGIFFLFLPHQRGDTAGWVEYLDFPLVHPFKSEQTQSLCLGRKAKDRQKKINHQATKSRRGEEKVQGRRTRPLCFLLPVPSN